MTAPNETISARLDDLQRAFDELVVQAAKAIKESSRDARGGHTAASASLAARFEAPTHDYHTALDEIEREITTAMSVNLRDLKELREKRMPPPVTAPVAAANSQPVAPPAPMTVDLDSPAISTATPVAVPAAPASQPFNPPAAARPSKPESKPPAPVPDMGFDLTVSPEVRASPSPALSQAKAKQVKSSPKTSPTLTAAQTAAMGGRPGSAPPKKEPKVGSQSQASRAAASTPQAPAPAPSAPVAPPAPMTEPAMSLPPSGATSTATTAQPARTQDQTPQHEIFTNMAFSVAPAASEPTLGGAQMQMQAPAQQQQAASDSNTNMLGMTQFGAPADMTGNFNMASFDASLLDLPPDMLNNSSNNTNNLLGNDESNNNPAMGMTDLDADIEKLFDSNGPNSAERMDMDYGLGDIELDNSNFDDINWGEDNNGNTDFGPDLYASDL